MQVLREVVLAAVALGASALVVWGVSDWSVPAAKVTAGVLVAVLGGLFLIEAREG